MLCLQSKISQEKSRFDALANRNGQEHTLYYQIRVHGAIRDITVQSDDTYQDTNRTKMKRARSGESLIELNAPMLQVILLDVIITYVTRFVPRSNWFAFQLVSKQFLRCARELGHSVIRPNHDDFMRMCSRGNLKSVEMILRDYKTDPSSFDNDAILWASCWGRTKVVALLLADSRVDPAADNNFAILEASWRGHSEVVTLLLADPRVDPAAVAYFSPIREPLLFGDINA